MISYVASKGSVTADAPDLRAKSHSTDGRAQPHRPEVAVQDHRERSSSSRPEPDGVQGATARRRGVGGSSPSAPPQAGGRPTASRRTFPVDVSDDGHRSIVRSEVAAHEVYGLGVRTDLVTACRLALGVGSTTAYALAARKELPFPAYRVGRQWVVPTSGLLTFLGLAPAGAPTPQETPTHSET